MSELHPRDVYRKGLIGSEALSNPIRVTLESGVVPRADPSSVLNLEEGSLRHVLDNCSFFVMAPGQATPRADGPVIIDADLATESNRHTVVVVTEQGASR